MIAFHIEFADGSNPYFHFACSKKKHESELRKWRRNYNLEFIKVVANIEYYRAERK